MIFISLKLEFLTRKKKLFRASYLQGTSVVKATHISYLFIV